MIFQALDNRQQKTGIFEAKETNQITPTSARTYCLSFQTREWGGEMKWRLTEVQNMDKDLTE